jgi:hypothetical protein
MQGFQPPQMFSPSAPQLPPPPPMHAQSPSVFIPSWSNPPVDHQAYYSQPPLQPPPQPKQEALDSSGPG